MRHAALGVLVGILGGVAAGLSACGEDDDTIEGAGQDAALPADASTPAVLDERSEASVTIDACADGGCRPPPVCGDGVLEGEELCDDGDAGIGCSPACVFDPGYACDEAGAPCRRTTCNDGKREGSEACDDGNNDLGDRCTPSCKNEPECPVAPGACTSVCGDGIKTETEACDDGNRDDGDGCSRRCVVEPGWTCGPRTTPTATMTIPSVVRDFKMGWNIVGGGGAQTPIRGGHPDFENNTQNRERIDPMITKPLLGPDGKVAYFRDSDQEGGSTSTTNKTSFDQWFRDVPGVNVTVVVPLTFTYSSGTNTYTFLDTTYFPIDARGFGNQGLSNNFHFTFETRFWFEYAGGEKLSIASDDDAWVFVNRRRVVDLGGVHASVASPVVDLDAVRTTLGLVRGSIYEAVVFKAERKVTSSSFRIDLTGFRDRTSVCRR